MDDGIDVAQAARREVRWLILLTLYHARPVGAAERLVLRTIQDVPLSITPDVVRRELVYLEDLGLVRVERRVPQWHGELTAPGVDLVEYSAECPPSIGRPTRYW